MMGSLNDKVRWIDIGANMCDPMFHGVYNKKKYHEDCVFERAWNNNLEKIVLTSGSLSDLEKSLELCRKDDRLFTTAGCHPISTTEWHLSTCADSYLNKLMALLEEEAGKKIVAIGELGLDYDRLMYSEKNIQLKYFIKQMDTLLNHGLPLFLHCRNSFHDFIEILSRYRSQFNTGVVHSFTGSVEEAHAFLKLDLYIGINGCSLKTKENLEVVKTIPLDRILLETDSPWCSIRPSHAGFSLIDGCIRDVPMTTKEKFFKGKFIKHRNEPSMITMVASAVSALRNISLEELSRTVYENTNKFLTKN